MSDLRAVGFPRFQIKSNQPTRDKIDEIFEMDQIQYKKYQGQESTDEMQNQYLLDCWGFV